MLAFAEEPVQLLLDHFLHRDAVRLALPPVVRGAVERQLHFERGPGSVGGVNGGLRLGRRLRHGGLGRPGDGEVLSWLGERRRRFILR